MVFNSTFDKSLVTFKLCITISENQIETENETQIHK